jgi:5-methylthioadenosine/S-adenosylhomocysteine deaminase
VRLDALETQPVYHAISQLVYTAGRRHVSDVWIAGVRKVENGTVLGVDVDELRGRAQAWQSRITDLS